MRLWTAQPDSVCRQVMERGVYRTDPEQIQCFQMDETFRDAYDWLVPEMEKRIGSRPEGVSYPIWAYAVYDGIPQEPDRSCIGREGEELWMLTLEVPDNEAVLTDHGLWHYVLNRWHIGDALTEPEWEKEEEDFSKLSPAERKRRTIESWQKVFNVEKFDNGFVTTGMYVQATFWELRREYVIKAERFIVPPFRDDDEA